MLGTAPFMKSYLIVLLCFLLIGCNGEDVYYESRTSYAIDTSIFAVEYGVMDGEVKFAVFSAGKGNLKLPGIQYELYHGKRRVVRAVLNLNGKEKDILKDGGVFQIIDGKVEEKRLKVTLSDLSAFLASEPPVISAKQLSEFINNKRK